MLSRLSCVSVPPGSTLDNPREQNSFFMTTRTRPRWDKELISQGNKFLERSANGQNITSFHLEAGIAFWHSQKGGYPEKWLNILHHYDFLLQLNYSPVVALNRIYAVYKAKGRDNALTELVNQPLPQNHFFFLLLGELYKVTDDKKARQNFEKALTLAGTKSEKQEIRKRYSH
ncbi:MAG TPA: hypothetical protein VKR32_02195 [Puia sp.]|nr:hypothetical protein [Puia sp.]